MGASIPILQRGSLAKPSWAKESRLRLSAYARQLGCVGVILFNEGNPLGAVIGPTGPYAKVVNTSNVNALVSTEEGYCYQSGSFRSAAVTLPIGPLISGTNLSDCFTLISRMKCPAGNGGGRVIQFQSTSGLGSISLGFDSTSHPMAGSAGNSGVGVATAATAYADQFVTLGIQCDVADQHPNLFVNGVLSATASAGSGANQWTGNLYLDMGTAGNAFYFEYVLLFRKRLSDAEHFYVARNPWSLLEFTGPLGKTFAGGGNVYNVSMSESASGADSPSSQGNLGANDNETGTAAETITTQAVFPRTVAETASPADTVTNGATYGAIIAETASPADTESAQMTIPAAVSESAPISEQVQNQGVFPRAVNESSPITDSESSQGVHGVGNSETASAVETITTQATFPRTVAESAPASELVANTATLPSGIVETAPISDQDSAAGPGQSDIVESAPITDQYSAQMIRPAGVTESAPISDSYLASVTLTVILAEIAAASNTQTAQLVAAAAIAETGGIVDQTAAQLIAQIAIQEHADAQDAFAQTGTVLVATPCNLLAGAPRILMLAGEPRVRLLQGGCCP